MLNPGLHIHSSGFIAPAAIRGEAVMRLSAQEPDYAGIIPPMQLRRMSKAVRMGIGAALACLGAAKPDAIATGTTMGCVQDTEVFLNKLVAQEERMLTPTAFIQSTHNTVAGQIALLTGCRGYNTTISQRGHSFEGAVMSAALYLAEHPEHAILCGGVDELTDTSVALLQRSGVYTRRPFAPETILEAEHSAAIAGEGAGFLLLTTHAAGAKAAISGLAQLADREAGDALSDIRACLAAGHADPGTDALWLGASGDPHRDATYAALREDWGRGSTLFKAVTGEWGTAIAVALCRIVAAWPEGKERAWIVNHYGRDWSVWLLERPA
jgi:F0F1-type ATP synthase membrane subunit c/vacuolar-type H+-ATPase subunit K